ncbi:hypothetical protein GCM10020221_25150 [Streptomyces thioluteus]|uniref:Uncharacterized protein n=1 Tax=Streptomyces thioluteus TaxID=66431 RepID=A0ABP6JDI6_STRTU
MADAWGWEYDPDSDFVIGGIDNLAFVAKVEERADELVRAASALYLGGTKYDGISPLMQEESIDASGLFVYQVIPRHQRVCIRRVIFFAA